MAAADDFFLPDVELGVGDGDLDLLPKLGVRRCRPKFGIRSRILFLPDLLSPPLDIVWLLLGKFWATTSTLKRSIDNEGVMWAIVVVCLPKPPH